MTAQRGSAERAQRARQALRSDDDERPSVAAKTAAPDARAIGAGTPAGPQLHAIDASRASPTVASAPDWDPTSETARKDQIAAYDEVRRRCPVARSEWMHWSFFRHEDVLRALHDHATFSNEVSTRRSVPNGMDPPEHTAYRRLIEPYFDAQRIAAFEPRCRAIARELLEQFPANGGVELMAQFAESYALRAQCAFLGWSTELHEALRDWVHKNHEAIRSGDRARMAAVALEFDQHIRSVLDERRSAASARPGEEDDVATRLLREQVHGRQLTDEEIISILRNWTVGELATLSAALGILAQYLAERPKLQQQLRQEPVLLPAAIDEILRIHAPLIASRRVTTAPVPVNGRQLAAGERVTLMWASANRDEAVFGDPDEFRLDRDPALNLLYGAGIHVCPGAPLARLELRIAMEVLLAGTRRITPAPNTRPANAVYPASGYTSVPLWIVKT